jgi:hypothetical protein
MLDPRHGLDEKFFQGLVDDKFYEALLRVGCPHFCDEARAMIATTLATTVEWARGRQSGEIKKNLRRHAELSKKARELKELLRIYIDPGDLISVRDQYMLFDLAQFIDHHEFLARHVPKRGRAACDSADYLILSLADIYRASGGQVALGGGPFSKFLHAIYSKAPSVLGIAVSSDALLKRAKALLPKIRAQEAELKWVFPLFPDQAGK